MFGCEMGVLHDHLKRPVAEQLCHCAQIHPGHNESTGKGVAVAMPAIVSYLRLFLGCRKPPTGSLQRISRPGGRKNRLRTPRLAVAS